MIRLFAAVEIPEEIGVDLVLRQGGIDGARWRPLDALHITLRFGGDLPEDQAEDFDAELAALAAEPFDLTLQGAGSFGEGERIHAVWAGVRESAALRRLHERCEAAARRAGLKPETRRYTPHVTLAYLNRPDPVQVAAWVQANNLLTSEPFRVTWFGLYSSALLAGGSRYQVEREYPLV